MSIWWSIIVECVVEVCVVHAPLLVYLFRVSVRSLFVFVMIVIPSVVPEVRLTPNLRTRPTNNKRTSTQGAKHWSCARQRWVLFHRYSACSKIPWKVLVVLIIGYPITCARTALYVTAYLVPTVSFTIAGRVVMVFVNRVHLIANLFRYEAWISFIVCVSSAHKDNHYPLWTTACNASEIEILSIRSVFQSDIVHHYQLCGFRVNHVLFYPNTSFVSWFNFRGLSVMWVSNLHLMPILVMNHCFLFIGCYEGGRSYHSCVVSSVISWLLNIIFCMWCVIFLEWSLP